MLNTRFWFRVLTRESRCSEAREPGTYDKVIIIISLSPLSSPGKNWKRIFWISVKNSMLQQKNVSRVQTFRQRRDLAREERIAWQKRKNPSPEIRFSVHLSSYILFLLLLSMRLYYMPPTFCSNFVFGVRLYPLHNFNFFSQKSIRQSA